MSKTVSPKQDETTVDVKLMKALGHPLRQRILQVLTGDKERSPSEIAQAIDEPLTNVSYHVRILAKCDAIELVRTKVAKTTVEHFYRAKVRAVVDENNWRNMPESVRESLLNETFQRIWSNVRVASEGDGLKDPRTAAAWNALRLDDEAFAEVSRMVGDLMERALALQSASEQRLAGLDPEERESKTHLVELDAMLYPINEVPTTGRISRQSQAESNSTGSNSD